MCPCDGQYFHFASGRKYIVSLLSYPVPEWRNGRRRGFKIPRLHGRVSSSLTLGTIIAVKSFYKLQKLHVFLRNQSVADISNWFELIITYFFLKKKYTLLLLDYYTSAQFDGEEQKAGAIASVFFRST